MKKILLVLSFLAVSLFAKIDINTATVADFASIKGISKAKAEAIVKYREKNGKFASFKDLQKVKGVGPSIAKNVEKDIKKKKSKKSAKKNKKADKKVNKTKKSNEKKADEKKPGKKKTNKKKSNKKKADKKKSNEKQ